MKKIYLMAFALGAFAFTSNSQILTEDFESYSNFEPIFGGIWTTWDGTNDGAQNMLAVTAQAFEGDLSGFIGAGEGPQDAVLDFPGAAFTTGTYTLQFRMYIPTGSSGYYNLQGDVDPSANDNLDFLSNNVTFLDGTMRITPDPDPNSATVGEVIPYPSDEWFTVTNIVDLDADTYEIIVNGNSATAIATGSDNYGGVDFFASQTNNQAYFDNIVLIEGLLGVDDFSADVFSVYPNPVQDILNIQSRASVDSVVIYDVLGKRVLSVQPDAISPSIDMSNLRSGAYMVNITIGNATKTVKVMK